MSDQKKKPGCLWPAGWLIFGLLGTLTAAAAVGIAGSGSESAGMNVAYGVAFPLGFLWTGGLVALIVHFLNKGGKGARYGAPLGCGCLGGLLLVALIVAFFTAIWPSL
jgi:peptidoglycan/LPS O-acetylase OafA/YrhL